MRIKADKLIPLFVCALAIGLVCLLQQMTKHFPSFNLFQRLEWMTYDWRMREAQKYPSTNASNLGLVFISDESVAALINGELDYKAGLYWPRHVYGRLVNELATQGAKLVAFDILFAELRPDHPSVLLPDLTEEPSDKFFARHLGLAGNVALGAEKGVVPPPLFRTNSWRLGDISAKRDADGVLRRARAFDEYLLWHPLIEGAVKAWGLDLRQTRIEKSGITFSLSGKPLKIIPLDQEGKFNQAQLYLELTSRIPPVSARPVKPYTTLRVWNLGIVMAAKELGLELETARVEPGRIVLYGKNDIQRVLPVDEENRFYIDWNFTPYDPRLTRERFDLLLKQEQDRRLGKLDSLTNQWAGKLVLVGSTASGNDLTDIGATPIEKETYLTTGILNAANSLIVGRFIQPPSNGIELFMIVILGIVTWPLAWNFRPLWATVGILALAAAYFWLARYWFVQQRTWVPVILPFTSLLLSHFSLLTYETFFEQKERRRIRGVFSKIVSPNIVNELLTAPKLSLVGARREVTVYFADIRGFTELTDTNQANAEAYIREHQLSGIEAESHFNSQSKELLETINMYLGLIADTIKRHDGTLDKYIGDCVMAFWGAPTHMDDHAVRCVKAAIDAQRAIYSLNLLRAEENKRREEENKLRAAKGESLLPQIKLLSLGTGVNTGVVTVGLMGSDAHIVNYTVLGREVNLASRLEGFSGRGRILIGEGTYQSLLKHAPALANTCLEQPLATLRGFSSAVRVYEVPWKVSTSDATLEAPAVPDAALKVKASSI